uniref:UDP-glucuronosyltransferase n=1 Tax=Angiostrongylus cantonensis TaxID=6313 RepID=A0A158PBA7_ANGCA
MFSAGDAYDLWWTGQEFKEMRVEACAQMLNQDPKVFEKFREMSFDLAIAHFHDLCPLAVAEKIGIHKMVWITHGTSIYDFAAVQLGLRTLPAYVPHPLSSAGSSLSFFDRVLNLLWHLSLLDFVNLPQNLLHDENVYYRNLVGFDTSDLWDLSRHVMALLINGERMLDFPRPLPCHITFSGELGLKKGKVFRAKKFTKSDNFTNVSATENVEFDEQLQIILSRPSKGLIVFSLGTVSNTTNMPQQMIDSFVKAFNRLSDYTVLWRMEGKVKEAELSEHVFLLKWLPQKDIMKLPSMKLLVAHGGYNSFLEAAQAGVPVVLMPLFADQKINAMRAQRFGIARVLNKLRLTPENVYEAISDVLGDDRCVLSDLDFPSQQPYSTLKYVLKLATSDAKYFGLRAAQQLSFFEFYSLDIVAFLVTIVAFLSVEIQ